MEKTLLDLSKKYLDDLKGALEIYEAMKIDEPISVTNVNGICQVVYSIRTTLKKHHNVAEFSSFIKDLYCCLYGDTFTGEYLAPRLTLFAAEDKLTVEAYKNSVKPRIEFLTIAIKRIEESIENERIKEAAFLRFGTMSLEKIVYERNLFKKTLSRYAGAAFAEKYDDLDPAILAGICRAIFYEETGVLRDRIPDRFLDLVDFWLDLFGEKKNVHTSHYWTTAYDFWIDDENADISEIVRIALTPRRESIEKIVALYDKYLATVPEYVEESKKARDAFENHFSEEDIRKKSDEDAQRVAGMFFTAKSMTPKREEPVGGPVFNMTMKFKNDLGDVIADTENKRVYRRIKNRDDVDRYLADEKLKLVRTSHKFDSPILGVNLGRRDIETHRFRLSDHPSGLTHIIVFDSGDTIEIRNGNILLTDQFWIRRDIVRIEHFIGMKITGGHIQKLAFSWQPCEAAVSSVATHVIRIVTDEDGSVVEGPEILPRHKSSNKTI